MGCLDAEDLDRIALSILDMPHMRAVVWRLRCFLPRRFPHHRRCDRHLRESDVVGMRQSPDWLDYWEFRYCQHAEAEEEDSWDSMLEDSAGRMELYGHCHVPVEEDVRTATEGGAAAVDAAAVDAAGCSRASLETARHPNADRGHADAAATPSRWIDINRRRRCRSLCRRPFGARRRSRPM